MTKTPIHVAVSEFTTPSPQTASPESGVQELRAMLSQGGFRHLPIVESGEVVGLISDRDLKVLDGLGSLNRQVCAADIMRRELLIVDPDTPLADVAFQMSEMKVGSAIVRDVSGEFLGIFTSTDALNALIELLHGEIEED